MTHSCRAERDYVQEQLTRERSQEARFAREVEGVGFEEETCAADVQPMSSIKMTIAVSNSVLYSTHKILEKETSGCRWRDGLS